MISVNVVRPLAAFLKPSSFSVIIPSVIASLFSSNAFAPPITASSSVSFISRTSWMAIRPL